MDDGQVMYIEGTGGVFNQPVPVPDFVTSVFMIVNRHGGYECLDSGITPLPHPARGPAGMTAEEPKGEATPRRNQHLDPHRP